MDGLVVMEMKNPAVQRLRQVKLIQARPPDVYLPVFLNLQHQISFFFKHVSDKHLHRCATVTLQADDCRDVYIFGISCCERALTLAIVSPESVQQVDGGAAQ